MCLVAIVFADVDVTAAAEKFTEGFIYGAFQDNTYVEKCLSNSETLYTDFTVMIQDFQRANGTNTALLAASKLLLDLQTAIEECDNTEQYTDLFDKVTKEFANPWNLFEDLGKSVIFNGIEIIGDVRRMIDSLAANNWYNTGKNFGNLVVTIFNIESQPTF